MRTHLITRALGVAIISALLGACDDPVGTAADAAWVKATIEGAVQTLYEGTGDFHVGSDPRAGISVQFTLNSEGTGATAGQRLMLYRRGEARPAEGSYALAPLEEKDGEFQGFTAYYNRRTDGRLEAFTARLGGVQITESSEERIAGTFRFTGALYCSRPLSGGSEDDVHCTGPNTIDPAAPQIEVVGSFVATPSEPGTVTPER